jgi:hypothetical protein
MSEIPDPLGAAYQTAARRLFELHRRWERMVLSDPLGPGEDEWRITSGQLDSKSRYTGCGTTTSKYGMPM